MAVKSDPLIVSESDAVVVFVGGGAGAVVAAGFGLLGCFYFYYLINGFRKF